MGVRWRGIWLSVIAMALPAVLSATAAASPETGLVASIDVVRGGAEHALPVDRRYLRLRPGDETLRVREQGMRIERAVAERDFEPGQDVAVERILTLVQALAGAATEEGARLAGKVQRMRGPSVGPGV